MEFRLRIRHKNLTLFTESFRTLAEAEVTIDDLKPEFTDITIEESIPGIGWIPVDEVETVMICRRRQE